MMVCKWKTFTTDTEMYTQEVFEEMVGDKFEAMLIRDNESIPPVIWTDNFVVMIKNSSSLFSDITFEKIPRNPVLK